MSEQSLVKMNKMIKRTITSTNVKFKVITDVDGELTGEEKTALFDGEVSLEKATQLIKKEFKDDLLGKTFLVTEVLPTTKMYELSQGDFIKYGTEVIETPKEKSEE